MEGKLARNASVRENCLCCRWAMNPGLRQRATSLRTLQSRRSIPPNDIYTKDNYKKRALRHEMECFEVDALTSDTTAPGLGPFLGLLPHEMRLEIIYYVADECFPIGSQRPLPTLEEAHNSARLKRMNSDNPDYAHIFILQEYRQRVAQLYALANASKVFYMLIRALHRNMFAVLQGYQNDFRYGPHGARFMDPRPTFCNLCNKEEELNLLPQWYVAAARACLWHDKTLVHWNRWTECKSDESKRAVRQPYNFFGAWTKCKHQDDFVYKPDGTRWRIAHPRKDIILSSSDDEEESELLIKTKIETQLRRRAKGLV